VGKCLEEGEDSLVVVAAAVYMLQHDERYNIVLDWRDVLETVINRRKLTDAQANPSTQRKRYLSPIWQITLYFTDKEQLYALLKRKETYIKSNTSHE